METLILPFACFTTVTLAVSAVAFVVRDVLCGVPDTAAQPAVIPRLLPATPANPEGLIPRVDAWIDRLVKENGGGMTAVAAVLWAVASGLTVATPFYLWRESLPISLGGFLLGAVVAMAVLIVQRHRRTRLMEAQLPEAIELLVKALRAGESLDQALRLVGDATSDPLRTEFQRCARHLEMGLSVKAALRGLCQRVPITEVRLMTVALVTHRRAGGALPQTLERLVKVTRDRMAYRAQFRAATAAGRLSTWIIALAGPLVATYFLIWQRDYIDNYIESRQGITMIATAIGLQVIGLLWVHRLVATD